MKKKSVARLLGKKTLGVAMAGAVALAFTPALPALAAENAADTTYLYAALSYTDYYSAEGVLNGSSSEAGTDADFYEAGNDAITQYDTGAYDAVSRATTNHGLHRGSYQGDVTLYDTAGGTYDLNGWDQTASPAKMILTDGTELDFSAGTITKTDGSTATMDHYLIKGFKYVPVAVKTSDLADFKTKYRTVDNGGTVSGGYTEGNGAVLSSYSYTAAVDANTNGLKTATKNADGSYSFSARTTGTGSGLEGQEQQNIASDAQAAGQSINDYLGVTVRHASGFGDNIRVDLLSNYGKLGAGMQEVKWEYYGSGDTVLATYGTKFAADNWMHRSQGIQLGLTFGKRCELPSGTDGSGKWKITISALGFADTSFEVTIDSDDVHPNRVDLSKLATAVQNGQAVQESQVTSESWTNLQTAIDSAATLYDTVDALLTDEDTTTADPRSAIYSAIDAIDNAIVYNVANATVTLSPASATYTGSAQQPTATVSLNGETLTAGTDYDVSYANNTNAGTATVTVTGKGSYGGTATQTFTIAQAANPVSAKASTKTVKLSKVKKTKQTVSAIKVSGAQGTVTYAKASGSGKLSVSKSNGKVTVKKGTKKGTYSAKVRVTAAGNANYAAGSKTVTVKVKVK